MKRVITAAAAALLVAGLAGCGTTEQTASPAAPAQPAAAAAADLDAEGVAKALAAAGLPAAVSVVFTEESDTNSLLGRPGQYTSKVAFVDSRLDPDEVAGEKGDIDLGGGVEVFETAKAAATRAAYISSITESISLVAEYTYQVGPRVLRLSKHLTPTQAKAYKAAFDALGGTS